MNAHVFAPAFASSGVRAKIASLWAFRAEGELEAAARFGRLAAELARAGATPMVVEMAAKASHDELRHHRLCAAVAASYGAEVRYETRDAAPVGDPSLPLRDRVLLEVVSLSCISETIAATVLTASAERAKAADIRAAVHAILKDEVEHSRLGWAHLAVEADARQCQLVASWLPRMLEAGVPADLFAPAPRDAAEDELADFGCLPAAELRAIFAETLAEVIFPGFEMLGVDARPARAWVESRSHSPRRDFDVTATLRSAPAATAR